MPRRPHRPGALSRRTLAGLRHTRSPEHLQRCAECRLALRRERQYLERLRGAAVPEASQDLAARLIQHTERLANEPGQSGFAQHYTPLPHPSPRFRGLRLMGVAAGTLVVSAGALAVSAYVIAGDTEPRVPAEASDAGTLGGAWTGSPVETMVGPAFRAGSTVSLSPGQLESLRDKGWACPELSAMGFHVVSAQAISSNGNPAVEIRLQNNGHYATIVEEHLPTDGSGPGRSTSAQLSVTQGTPWKAVYTMPSAVISYASDLPADAADDAVPEIVRAGESMSMTPAPEDHEAWYKRVLRGLQTLLRPAGLGAAPETR
ncbi:hypothetical protein [Paenarthrobacter aurescens]|uniref:hypothetical protein n=1 Tax=Paenarthrobacter aurescens TaxID=43663 RepID=UPI001FE7703F|nr:hypothetical protein [Paenarthrobacter aurescens]MDO6144197.1 hypothetical protein [Paenarthrobacter aurescens]MDO6148044.1 hypothetical protein [Paenarthrobacter aurescens]MDO6159288.1 hypothetical protein [Paenarthrobacter aurescens]MDO6163271.1 hypothetical protein [Paenarthrobacter aurescens]